MNRLPTLSFVAALAVAVSAPIGAAGAQPQRPAPTADGDLLLRVNGVARVPQGERVTTVIAIASDASVRGTVEEALVVVDGDAVVSGRVLGEATVVDGTLRVLPGARIDRVSLVDAELVAAPGAEIGVVERSRMADWRWSFRWMSFFAWVAVTIGVLAAGLLFAAVGWRVLRRSVGTMAREPGATAIGVLVALIVLPLVSIPLLMSGIGIPLGLGVLLLLLPALAMLGYLVTGTGIGLAILRWFRRRPETGKPFLAATIGLLLLQIIGLIPVVGGIVAFLASLVGAGALLVLAWRALRERTGEPRPAATAEG